MKKRKLLIVFSAVLLNLLFLAASCETDPVVGSDEGIKVINQVSFKITQLETSSSSLTATGTVKNTGPAKITSPWYVEGQFYADSTFTLKLGGDNDRITVPLESGVQTVWTLVFSDPDISEGQYQNFRVSNVRAFYDK